MAPFEESVSTLEASVKELKRRHIDIRYIDMGGGFGIPYKKEEGQARLDLTRLGKRLNETIEQFVKDLLKNIMEKFLLL